MISGLLESPRRRTSLGLGARSGGEPLRLRAGGEPPELARRRAAPSFSTGLFHMAILVPDRAELAHSLRRVTEQGWRLTGASDHLVSEALYLQDPEGNGIEIYRDRPRDEWGHDGGELRMATLPLDLDGVMAERAGRRVRQRHARRHHDGPRAPPGGGHPRRRGVLQRRARARGDGALLPGRAVRRGGRLPPSHRAQHLAERGRAGAAGGIARARPLRAGAARRGRARRRRGARGRDRRPGAARTTACSPPTRPGTAYS